MRVIHGGVEVQVDVRLRVVKIVHTCETVLAGVFVTPAAVVGEER